MSDKNQIWGIVAAVLGGGGSLIGGVAAFMTMNKGPEPQVQPAAAIVPAGAATEPQTPDKPPPSETEPQVRQVSLSAADHTRLQQMVTGLLDQVQGNFGANMQSTGQELASLPAGGVYDWRLNLSGGVAYRFIGACDGDCTNVDIQLVDAGGTVVAEDTLPDDFPVVDYTPAGDGAYQVRLLMRTCNVAPCYAGARMLTN